jgi:hypothetical protein
LPLKPVDGSYETVRKEIDVEPELPGKPVNRVLAVCEKAHQ